MKPRKKKASKKSAAARTAAGAPELTRYESDVLIRGEAAELTAQGKLPTHATHAKIKGPGGGVRLKRARYKLF